MKGREKIFFERSFAYYVSEFWELLLATTLDAIAHPGVQWA
jgi:hypothetical protein